MNITDLLTASLKNRQLTYAIRTLYVVSQSISNACAFAGTGFSLYDYRHPETRKPESAVNYFVIFGSTSIVTVMSGITANYFQGKKIGASEDDDDLLLGYPERPRSKKSNAAEASYLLFSFILLLVNNYFLVAATKATLTAFKNPKKIYPLIPLSTTLDYLVFFIKLSADWPFNTSNADYEACEGLKFEFTQSKAQPLVSLIWKPFMGRLVLPILLNWIKTSGALSHVLTDCISTILSVPATAFITLYQNTAAFWLVMTGIAAISIPLLVLNYIKTLYFEATESELNFQRLQRQNSVMPSYLVRSSKKKHHSLLRTILNWQPCLKNPMRYGFVSTQGLLHASSDTMPVILFMRDIVDRLEFNTGFETAITVLLGAIVFIGSFLGTHFSEVKMANKNYIEDFKDIPNSNFKCCLA